MGQQLLPLRGGNETVCKKGRPPWRRVVPSGPPAGFHATRLSWQASMMPLCYVEDVRYPFVIPQLSSG